ncbi:MAG: UvrB/UvrC motif-containing protein, partial [Tepidiphilus sp.]|nr:UvrB/UvrC motif-containing protein [Tepidiphilus sp.]
RAARNLHGTAILYADRITESMRRAIDETERRRAKQLAYNAEHGITPRGVTKRIKDIIDGVYGEEGENQPSARAVAATEVHWEESIDPTDEKAVARAIARLEKEMLEHARNLEFEAAAQVRDRLFRLRKRVFGADPHASLEE